MVSLRVATRTKRRIFVVVLAALLVWPLVHYALARRYQLDHWRFSGFAMYARPSYQPSLELGGQLGNQPLTPGRLRAALGADAARVDDFLAARRLWGRLARPTAMARLILARLPELPSLTVTINTVGLEPGADYLSYTTQRFRCARGTGCQELP